jgi:hypothetical protein
MCIIMSTWTRTQDLKLTFPASYALGYYVELDMNKNINRIKTKGYEQACVLNPHSCVLNRHVCELNRHAVWHGNNATHSVDSTRIQVIVFLNSRSYVPAN